LIDYITDLAYEEFTRFKKQIHIDSSTRIIRKYVRLVGNTLNKSMHNGMTNFVGA